jgi:hypothetical protein
MSVATKPVVHHTRAAITDRPVVEKRYDPPDPVRCRGHMKQKLLAKSCRYLVGVEGVDKDDRWAELEDAGKAAAAEDHVPADVVRRTICDLTQALDAGHKRGWIHGALTDTNIFLQRAKTSARLTDGRWVSPGEPLAADGQPIDPDALIYRAPEVLTGEPLSTKADIYSLGVLTLRLLLGPGFAAELGFPNNPETAQRFHLPQRFHLGGVGLKVPAHLEPHLGPAAWNTLVRMVSRNPTDRPTTTEIRKAFGGSRRFPILLGALLGVAAVVTVAAVAAVLRAGSTDSTPVPGPGPRPEVRGKVEVTDPGLARVPGQLETLGVRVVESSLLPAEQRIVARFERGDKQGDWIHLPIDRSWPELTAAARKAAAELGVPLKLVLGVGSETAIPDTDGRVTLPVGFPLPAGLTYPTDAPDARDGERWYAVARRIDDGQPVSVFRDPAGKGWFFVDQGPVTVRAYVDCFLPGAVPHLSAAAAAAGPPPARWPTFTGLQSDPLSGREAIAPGGWPAVAARGPLFYDPAAPEYQAGYRAYPPTTLRGYAPIDVNLKATADKNTNAFPVIGVSFVEAQAYRAWLNRDGANWQFHDDRVAAALSGPTGGPEPAPRAALDPYGRGAHGVHFWCSNVLEYVGPDPGAGVAGRGTAFSGRTAVNGRRLIEGPYDRPIDVSFRFMLRQEDR